jgi:hypothetical protein
MLKKTTVFRKKGVEIWASKYGRLTVCIQLINPSQNWIFPVRSYILPPLLNLLPLVDRNKAQKADWWREKIFLKADWWMERRGPEPSLSGHGGAAVGRLRAQQGH